MVFTGSSIAMAEETEVVEHQGVEWAKHNIKSVDGRGY